jgi:arylsulfatase A-like enzyme
VAAVVGAGLIGPAWGVDAVASPPPSIVFVLLDTTRADRLGAWGHDRPTSPALDALAADGVRFASHFANSHATRPSMPQLMSGRYYHQNVLRTFEPLAHPREFPFGRRPRRSALLPEILRGHGYATRGVSAHPWVVADSEFGRGFDRLELLPFEARAGHGDGKLLVDRAIEEWRMRPGDRPTFLYLHFMDAHMPRSVPASAPFPIPAAAGRFDDRGEPTFGSDRRRWARHDADDFTLSDRAHFAAVYDANVWYADAHLGRFVAAVRADDPTLARTLIVVTADHGEELGEDGRVDHGDALADAVQHVPWVMAGHGIAPGQVATASTEHVDVLATVLVAARLALPASVRTDGVSRLDADGNLITSHDAPVYFAWEDYRAVRTRTHLLRRAPQYAVDAACRAPAVYEAAGSRRVPLTPPPPALTAALDRRLDARLSQRERRFRAHRYDVPRSPFSFRPAFWRIEPAGAVRCHELSADTERDALGDGGWLWTGRGLTLLRAGDDARPITIAVDAPRGAYTAQVGVAQVAAMPRLWGFERWLRRSFRARPGQWIDLGAARADATGLRVTVAPELALGRHVVALKLTPPVVSDAPAPGPDEEQRERLRALGYLQ